MVLGLDPLGDPKPMGPPGSLSRGRRIRRHLADHCEFKQGLITALWEPDRGTINADGRTPPLREYVTVTFPVPTGQHDHTTLVPFGRRDALSLGQSVRVHCCPYYATSLFVVEWSTQDRGVCPRHRPAPPGWRRLLRL
jgi:hypothetical protein